MDSGEGIELTLKLSWKQNESVVTQHATSFLASHTVDSFYVSFGEVVAPYLNKPSEEEIAKLTSEGLDVKLLARFTVTPTKMKELLDVLNTNYAKFQEQLEVSGNE